MSQVQLSTILFLLRPGQVLLAMKKRGMGEGRWNGCGGKLEAGETAEQAAIRETHEEIGVVPRGPRLCADLAFDYVRGPRKAWRSYVYTATEWAGEPVETEEMIPRWFDLESLPLSEMWADDAFWLPRVLAGERLAGSFEFDGDDNVVRHELGPLAAGRRQPGS